MLYIYRSAAEDGSGRERDERRSTLNFHPYKKLSGTPHKGIFFVLLCAIQGVTDTHHYPDSNNEIIMNVVVGACPDTVVIRGVRSGRALTHTKLSQLLAQPFMAGLIILSP